MLQKQNQISLNLNTHKLLLTLLLLSFVWSCGSSTDQAAEENAQADTTQLLPPDTTTAAQIRNENQITGLLQTSGLQPQEAQALGLPQGGYQLISRQAYFLEGHDSLKAYLGQCVTLEGKEKDWAASQKPAAEQTTYNRRLFVVDKVYPQGYARCYFSDSLSSQPQGREVAYAGKVERMQRPAPDIAYDYQLRLQKPYRDENHPIQPGKLVETLPLVTADFEILSQLEAAVRQNNPLQLKGLQQQGYAEQEAVWLLSAERLNQ